MSQRDVLYTVQNESYMWRLFEKKIIKMTDPPWSCSVYKAKMDVISIISALYAAPRLGINVHDPGLLNLRDYF